MDISETDPGNRHLNVLNLNKIVWSLVTKIHWSRLLLSQ